MLTYIQVKLFLLRNYRVFINTYILELLQQKYHIRSHNFLLNCLALPVKFSADNIKMFFLFFPGKKNKQQDLTFHANCLQWRQSDEMIYPVFWDKQEKNISICHSAELVQRVVKVKVVSGLRYYCTFNR